MLKTLVTADLPGHFETVHARHFDVEQHHVRPVLFEQQHGVDAVLGRQHVHAMAFEQAAGDLAYGHRVIDHHDQQRPLRLGLEVLIGRTLWHMGLQGADRRQQIQNQHHPAIAQDRRAGNALHGRELRAEALDHDLASAGHGVDQHRDVPLVALHQQHRQRQVLAQQLRPWTGFQQFAQVAQFIALPGVFIGRRVEAEVPFEFVGQHTDDPVDGVQRDRVLILATLHHQRAVDRHRERQANAEMHALPRHGIDAHAAAQLPDFFVHDIHADAAPGNLGDFFGRGKPRLQDELQHVAVADFAVRVEQTALDRLAPHRLQRHAGTVIADIENDVATLARQVEGDPSLGRFTRRYSRLGRFKSMVHGIAQHVLQRCRHAFEHVAIHFAFGVFDDELNVLAQLLGNLTNDAFQARQHLFERHHARAHQAFLQLGVDTALLLQQVFRVLIAPVEGFLEVEQVGSGLEQCPRQLLQL